MGEIKTLITAEAIKTRIKELALAIEKAFNHEELIVVCILKGASIFCSDLVREIKVNTQLDFMIVSSYGNSTQTSGNIIIKKDVELDLQNKNVLIVEDIIDTGLTLMHLKNYFKNFNCKDVKICTLLNKEARRVCKLNVDFVGFEIPDEFVVDYGIDYAENYRNLPYIAHIIE